MFVPRLSYNIAVIRDIDSPYASNAYRADTKISTFEVLSTVDVEAFVDNTTLFTGFHCAGTKTVPSSLDVV